MSLNIKVFNILTYTQSGTRILDKQKKFTTMSYQTGLPIASISEPFKYADFADNIDGKDPAAVHEKLVWELAGVLFDPIDIPADLRDFPNAADRLRKDNVSAFWQKLVESSSNKHMALAKSSEEKAIACLAAHKITEACNNLVVGQDFHLATLVALVGGKDSVRRNIREQLDDWENSRILPEISQPVRALYEIIAGNVSVCEGSKGAPIEDRIDSFIISERFGLDWRQAFGLRLWYAILATDNLELAVQKFAEDLSQDRETARPQTWYTEQGVPALWDDAHLADREDLLWGLLKLYADPSTDLESVLRPENSQLSPLDVRLSWQLSQTLIATSHCSYGDDADEKADALTLAFASQLTNDGNWIDAIFVLLHLTHNVARAKSIQNHLAHHAGLIGQTDSPEYITLTQELHITPAWIWEAKALYMRSVKKDSRAEVECLLNAQTYDEAHRTLRREVAPRAVIERDYEMLRELLDGFKGREGWIGDWALGGEMYTDYLDLLDGQKKGKIDAKVVERLLAALPAMYGHEENATLYENVAIQEISGVLAKTVIGMGKNVSISSDQWIAHANSSQQKELPKLLRLPLTEDKYLQHTVDLSLGYYKSIMAGGR
jgi:nuclear pore complex protein Nup98-Nup96